ncbi:MAG TPA: hypothetical protein V6C72_16825, partial [Chroococcales cyanobacterium]
MKQTGIMAAAMLTLLVSPLQAFAQTAGTSPGITSTAIVAPGANVPGATISNFLAAPVPINSNAFGNYAPPPPGIP